LLSGLWTALGTSATEAQVIQTAYDSSQQELEDLQTAAIEVCQGMEEGEVQTGSSMASFLRALGGHITWRMRNALRLAVQKTLGVVVSHYRVNLGALSAGYIIPEGLDDADAEVEMNHVDALAALAVTLLADDFMEILFLDAPPAGPLEP
jgi:hypothetical protein